MPVVVLVTLFFAADVRSWFSASDVPPPEIEDLFGVTERFTYEVRYGFMRLGNVHVFHSDTLYNGKNHRKVTAVMTSNSNVPFVGYREYHYNTLLVYNDTTMYSNLFWVDNIHDEIESESRFEFDYENGVVYSWQKGEPSDTLELKGPSDGGPALFHLGRLIAGKDKDMSYTIYIDDEFNDVFIESTSDIDMIRSDIFDERRVPVYRSSGHTSLTGPFGFSGRFRALHHTGEMRIPLEARASVWIGNVTIRLIEYETL